MKEIRKIEEVIKLVEAGKAPKLDEVDLNPTLYWAYRQSKEIGLDTIDFSDIIWEKDIEPIVTTLREEGYESFTVTCNFSGLLETLYAFANLGCKLGEFKKIEQRYTIYNKETKQDERAREVGIEIWL